MARLSLESWLVESLRFSAFFAEQIAVSPAGVSGVWRAAVGKDPDNTHFHSPKQTLMEEGAFSSGRLQVTWQPNRVDWRFHASMDINSPSLPSMQVGPYPDHKREFEDTISRWLPQCPAVSRMAFGAVLVLPVEDVAAGYAQLDEMLPDVRMRTSEIRDFLYRVNRPRRSRLPELDLDINRLSTWSCVEAMLHALAGPHGASPSTLVALPPQSVMVACRLELDINTTLDFSSVLPEDSRHLLLQELIDAASEVAAKGDVE